MWIWNGKEKEPSVKLNQSSVPQTPIHYKSIRAGITSQNGQKHLVILRVVGQRRSHRIHQNWQFIMTSSCFQYYSKLPTNTQRVNSNQKSIESLLRANKCRLPVYGLLLAYKPQKTANVLWAEKPADSSNKSVGEQQNNARNGFIHQLNAW